MPINASTKEIYESYQMISPDGKFMSYVNKKRAEWYIDKNLASWIDDKKFQLNFEPKGLGKNHLPFYSEKLENQCVVCGDRDGGINKHHVVPYVFRSRFPNAYKESNHHDILATCIPCHDSYEHEAMKLKNKIMKDNGIEFHRKMTNDEKYNVDIIKARNLLEKIHNNEVDGSKIPTDKLKKIQQLSEKELINIEHQNTHWADEYIKHLDTEEKMFDFIKLWRTHFIETTKPKFLPKFWDINHPIEKS